MKSDNRKQCCAHVHMYKTAAVFCALEKSRKGTHMRRDGKGNGAFRIRCGERLGEKARRVNGNLQLAGMGGISRTCQRPGMGEAPGSLWG